MIFDVVPVHRSFSVFQQTEYPGRSRKLLRIAHWGRKLLLSFSYSPTFLGLWVTSVAVLIKIEFVPVKQWALLQQILDYFPHGLSLELTIQGLICFSRECPEIQSISFPFLSVMILFIPTVQRWLCYHQTLHPYYCIPAGNKNEMGMDISMLSVHFWAMKQTTTKPWLSQETYTRSSPLFRIMTNDHTYMQNSLRY